MQLKRDAFEYLYIHANSLAELALSQIALELELNMAGSAVELPELTSDEREAQALALMDQIDISSMVDYWEWGKGRLSETAVMNTPEPADAATQDYSLSYVKPAIKSDSSSNALPFGGTPHEMNLGAYLERAYASQDQIAPCVDAAMGKVDMAMLDTLLGTLPTDLTAITGRFNAEALAQWLAYYRASNHCGLNEIVVLIRNFGVSEFNTWVDEANDDLGGMP
jgi:hypothetical protein